VESVLAGSVEFGFLIPSDATGFAYHRSLAQAVDHALWELIERHLTWRVWSGQEHTLSFSENIEAATGSQCELHFFQTRKFPYCMVVCKGDNFLSIGAKCGPSVKLAIQGATSEAIMIYNEYCTENINVKLPERHKGKIERLRCASYRAEVLGHLIGNSQSHASGSNNASGQIFDAVSVVRAMGFDPREFYIAEFPSLTGVCVRVFSQVTDHPAISMEKAPHIREIPFF